MPFLRPAIVLVVASGLALTTSAQAADPEAGRKLARQCQTCHGLDGIATIPIAPHLAGESQIYLETQLKAFRSGRREHEIMSVVAKGLSDEEIANLAAWYASIRITATMPD
ncbi:c-type cytochrome [Halomonas sp. GXIMD04776]|uniref:c-type cytochrome n=1 Tax=Halomonas sp. GXIMD04776 TaxID=3415605 RepID=UPI003C8E90FB